MGQSGQTANRKLPFPVEADAPGDPAAAIQALANALDSDMWFGFGVASAKPAATNQLTGGAYYETDTGYLALCIGSAWIHPTPAISNLSIATAMIQDAAVTDAKIATGINGAKLTAGSTPGSALANGAVDAPQIANALKPSTGAGNSTEALRSIGSGFGQVMAGNAAPNPHHASHQPGGTDAIDWTTVQLSDLYANRPPASTTLNGVIFFATDKLMTWQCVAAAWVLRSVMAPEVTALPAAPVDQQECIYVADATNGIKWHFRYRAASASTYKWEYVGGAELEASVQTDEAHTVDNAWQDLTTVGPSITVPLAGDWDMTLAADMYNTTAAAITAMGIAWNNVNPASNSDLYIIRHVSPGAGGDNPITSSRTKRHVGRAAGDVARSKYWGNGLASHAHWANRVIRCCPARVG